MLQIIAIILLTGVDQLVKFLIKANIGLEESVSFLPGLIRLTHWENEGVAFSLFSGMRWPIVAVVSLMVILMIVVLVRKTFSHPLATWSLVFILSGALGNLIDRVLYGRITDMFEFEFIHFAIFNVADIFVVCGGIAFCIYLLFFHDKENKLKDPEAGSSHEN